MIVYFVQTHAGIKNTREFKDTCQLPIKKCHQFFFLTYTVNLLIYYMDYIFSTEMQFIVIDFMNCLLI